MSLHLITGGAASGKTARLLDMLVEGREDRVGTVLLAPSFAEVERLRATLAPRAPLGIEVTTLDSWALAQWALHGDGRAPVTSTVRRAVCSLVAERLEPPLDALEGRPGFAQLLADLAARVPRGAALPARSAVDAALAKAVREYHAALDAYGLIEPAWAFGEIGATWPGRGHRLGVVGFTDFASAQQELLIGLARENEVCVALTFREGAATTEALEPIVAAFLAAGASMEISTGEDGCPELLRLAASLYEPTEVLEPDGAVSLMEAAGSEAEAALAAAAVAQLLDEGFAPERIALTFRDVAGRRSLLEAALAARGIAFELDVAVPFSDTPLGRAVLALLSVARGTAGRSELVGFLGGPYSGAPANDVAKLDESWRRWRVDDHHRLLREAARLSPATGGIVELAERAARSRVSASSARYWQELGLALLAEASTGPRSLTDVRLDAAAIERLLSALREISAVDGLEVAGARFADDIGRTSVATGTGERYAAVQVVEVQRLRARRFDAVVLGGLTAGEFSTERQEPLAVELLRRFGLPSGTEERLSERMLFHTVLTRARERVVLIRQTTDAEGRALRPSTLLEEVVDVYRTPDEAREGAAGRLSVFERLPLSRLADAAPSFSAGRRVLRAEAAMGVIAVPKTSRGRLASGEGLVTEDAEFRVTELERYHACPYSWFYDRVVRPKALDREFGAAEKGSSAHAALAEVYRRLRAGGIARVTHDCLPEVLKVADAVIDQARIDAEKEISGLSEELALAGALRWVRNTLVADADLFEGFVPVAEEWAFGVAAGTPFEFAGVRVRGHVDRIDKGPRGLLVTDYKSKGAVEGAGSFESKGRLQLLVYSAAAADAMSTATAGSFYRSLSTGDLRGFWLDDREPESWVKGADRLAQESVEALMAWAHEAVAGAAEGIRRGDIAARPRHKDACTWCSAAAFCEGRRS